MADEQEVSVSKNKITLTIITFVSMILFGGTMIWNTSSKYTELEFRVRAVEITVKKQEEISCEISKSNTDFKVLFAKIFSQLEAINEKLDRLNK